MRKIQKMCAALLAGVMTVGTFAPSVFADEAAKELTDEQVINVRTTLSETTTMFRTWAGDG